MSQSKTDNPDFIIETFQLPINDSETFTGMKVVINSHQRRGLPKGNATFIPPCSTQKIPGLFSSHPRRLVRHLLREGSSPLPVI